MISISQMHPAANAIASRVDTGPSCQNRRLLRRTFPPGRLARPAVPGPRSSNYCSRDFAAIALHSSDKIPTVHLFPGRVEDSCRPTPGAGISRPYGPSPCETGDVSETASMHGHEAETVARGSKLVKSLAHFQTVFTDFSARIPGPCRSRRKPHVARPRQTYWASDRPANAISRSRRNSSTKRLAPKHSR